MTSQVSLLPGEVAISAGTYTDIVAIEAPSNARAGESVPVTIKVKNKWTTSVHVWAFGIYDSAVRFIEKKELIPAGSTRSFSGSFVMPDRDITIHAYSWYEDVDGYWRPDDEAARGVRLEEVAIGWQLLDSRILAVKLALPAVGWQLLDSRTIPVKSRPLVVGWQLLDSRTIPVKSRAAPVVGWQLLDEKTVSLTTGPAEEVWQLIQHTIYPWSYIFEGDAEACTFEFKLTPEQIPGTEWLRERIVDAFASELEKEGSRLLELKVYEDTTPMLWTNYRIEVTATASPIAWMPIIIAVLAILFIVAIIFLIKTIDEVFFKRKPLDEETKKTFSRETLTAMILDLAPERPPETLEGMDDQELRDELNRLLAEVAPPVSWLPIAILGGLGVLGVGGVLAAGALAKPKE